MKRIGEKEEGYKILEDPSISRILLMAGIYL